MLQKTSTKSNQQQVEILPKKPEREEITPKKKKKVEILAPPPSSIDPEDEEIARLERLLGVTPKG